MLRVEQFVLKNDDILHHNARLPSDMLDKQTEQMAESLKRQRRDRASLTVSQQRRLEAASGFSWDPLGDAWSAHIADWLTWRVALGVALPSVSGHGVMRL
ncbi:hypothetical protein [Cryobacterium sp. M23]|uniref:hypothetical protein n=1 Tax=Cryobacterium sp. M23 TaxID=2048292 RepID=UPI000CE340E0|nr:hypothetical protein [Cryobacterium sp. M23]